jgi:MoaA/NifB/PqqE/SkfB family radical SAM enzyme
MRPEERIPVPAWLRGFRRFPLDGALLLFDRATGLNARCEGPETAHLRMRAPRAVQFAITNACNLSCAFCSRDQASASHWTLESAFEMLKGLSEAGVLEVAFGGGEPFVFRGFEKLLERLHAETALAVHATTNGTRLTEDLVRAVRPHLGELRVSLYEDNAWRDTVRMLSRLGVRFGVNWLVTPERLPFVEATVLELVALGCGDVLMLNYKGPDATLHLSAAQKEALAGSVMTLAGALGRRCALKLDVCWSEHLDVVPRLFAKADCGAGREFVVLTSDQRMMPCSFHHLSIPATSASHVLARWTDQAHALREAANIRGCSRRPLVT